MVEEVAKDTVAAAHILYQSALEVVYSLYVFVHTVTLGRICPSPSFLAKPHSKSILSTLLVSFTVALFRDLEKLSVAPLKRAAVSGRLELLREGIVCNRRLWSRRKEASRGELSALPVDGSGSSQAGNGIDNIPYASSLTISSNSSGKDAKLDSVLQISTGEMPRSFRR